MNIFVVEDEYWALTELEMLMQKYHPEHNIYSFTSGEEVIAILGDVKPDLVLTDITMPGLNGLELIEHLKSVDETIKFIILSVHDQFSYAQQGIKLGVVEYLTKPVKEDEFYRVVDRSIALWLKENEEKEEKRNWYVNKMLFSEGKTEDTFLIDKADYMVVYLLASHWHKGKGDLNLLPEELLKSLLSHDGLVTVENILCTNLDSKRKLILLPFDKHLRYNYYAGKVRRLFDCLSHNKIVHVSCRRKKRSESLKVTVNALERQLERVMLFGRPSLIFPGDKERAIDLSDEWMSIRMIGAAIKNGEIDDAKKHVHMMVQSIRNKKVTVRQMQILVRDIRYSLAYELHKRQEPASHGALADDLELYQFSNHTDLSGWLTDLIDQLVRECKPVDVVPKNLIPHVINWIHQQYSNNLKFKNFADDNHVSLGYLSREFKLQTGETFSDYLKSYRISRAKEYFNKGMIRTSEVSRMVGYEDDKYFRVVFKMTEGITPAEYKKKIKQSK